MSLTTSDIVRDAGLFRRAQPHWPHGEPDDNCWSCGHAPDQECLCDCCPLDESEAVR